MTTPRMSMGRNKVEISLSNGTMNTSVLNLKGKTANKHGMVSPESNETHSEAARHGSFSTMSSDEIRAAVRTRLIENGEMPSFDAQKMAEEVKDRVEEMNERKRRGRKH